MYRTTWSRGKTKDRVGSASTWSAAWMPPQSLRAPPDFGLTCRKRQPHLHSRTHHRLHSLSDLVHTRSRRKTSQEGPDQAAHARPHTLSSHADHQGRLRLTLLSLTACLSVNSSGHLQCHPSQSECFTPASLDA